ARFSRGWSSDVCSSDLLDPGARLACWDLMERVRRKEGITLPLATHTMDEAARCDRLAIIDEGHLMASGSPEELTAELGSETLWIETADPRSLASSIHAQLGKIGRASCRERG